MRNEASKQYPRFINYTEVLEKYEGYVIQWATSPSESEPGGWIGHFHATKDDAAPISGTTGIPEGIEGDARSKAVDFAKARIDEAVAAGS